MSLAAALASAYGASPRGWSGFLSRADFISDLLYTAVPQRSAPGTTATFTRATTKTWQSNDGYLVTGVAGEIGFPGARRVGNLLTATQALGAAPWAAVVSGIATVTPTTGQSDPWGGTTAAKIVFSASNTTDVSVWRYAATVVQANSHVSSCYIRADTPTTIYLRRGGSASFSSFSVTTSWTRFEGVVAAAASTTANFDFSPKPDAITGTAGATIYVAGAQLEDVTAQTTQTAGEYVSVGVESAPYYHGSMADGVKCFPTDINGAALTTMTRYKPELAATNLLTYSNDISNAAWVKAASDTKVQNTVTGPDGATSGATYTFGTSNEAHSFYNTATVAAGATVAFSRYIKAGTQQYVSLGIGNGANQTWCVIDTTTMTFVNTINNTGTGVFGSRVIELLGNGWYRATISGSLTGVTVYALTLGASNVANPSAMAPAYAGTSLTVFTANAQGELGSSASSYIATTTAAVTRNADVLTYTGGDIPNLKTLAATFRREVWVSNNGWVAALSDGTVNNYESISTPSGTQARFLGVSGAATQWDVIPAYTAGSTSKAAFSAATNDVKMAKDGVGQTPDTVATLPTITQLNIGHIAGLLQLSGNVGGIYGWTRNLSQSEANAVAT